MMTGYCENVASSLPRGECHNIWHSLYLGYFKQTHCPRYWTVISFLRGCLGLWVHIYISIYQCGKLWMIWLRCSERELRDKRSDQNRRYLTNFVGASSRNLVLFSVTNIINGNLEGRAGAGSGQGSERESWAPRVNIDLYALGFLNCHVRVI